jgi:hypothetical protein
MDITWTPTGGFDRICSVTDKISDQKMYLIKTEEKNETHLMSTTCIPEVLRFSR